MTSEASGPTWRSTNPRCGLCSDIGRLLWTGRIGTRLERAPSVAQPESFAAEAAFTFGEGANPAFQRRLFLAVRLPERFPGRLLLRRRSTGSPARRQWPHEATSTERVRSGRRGFEVCGPSVLALEEDVRHGAGRKGEPELEEPVGEHGERRVGTWYP